MGGGGRKAAGERGDARAGGGQGREGRGAGGRLGEGLVSRDLRMGRQEGLPRGLVADLLRRRGLQGQQDLPGGRDFSKRGACLPQMQSDSCRREGKAIL